MGGVLLLLVAVGFSLFLVFGLILRIVFGAHCFSCSMLNCDYFFDCSIDPKSNTDDVEFLDENRKISSLNRDIDSYESTKLKKVI